MHCIKKRQVSLKKSKEKNKKIGTRSIHDIIYNTAELTFKQKVDYIRHHYVYYQGNYEYFHTQNGSPNAKKFKLNKLIAQIIKGEKNASELKEINSQILQWRKERNDELERLNRKSLDSIPLPDIPTIKTTRVESMPYWKKQLGKNENPYVTLIEEFLQSEANDLCKNTLESISYQDLKKLAIDWKKHDLKNAEESYTNKINQVVLNKLKREEEKEEKRVYHLMKEYAKDLGYV